MAAHCEPQETYGPFEVEQTLWLGDNDPPLVWEFGDATTPDILNGSVFELTIRYAHNRPDLILLSSDDDSTLTVDEPARQVRWEYTRAESAAILQGRHSHVLRRIIDEKARTWAYGPFIARSGLTRG